MDVNTATEISYKNGYLQGLDDGIKKVFSDLELKSPFFCESQAAYDHFNETIAELKEKYAALIQEHKEEGSIQ